MTDLITLIGAPVDCGGARRGCRMGPDMLRTAGLARALSGLGLTVRDHGDLGPDRADPPAHPNAAIHDMAESAGWTAALMRAAQAAEGVPIFMGGDHLLSAGTVAGRAAHAAGRGRPLFVLWLDAHSDCHDLDSTASGNLHGAPVAYFTQRAEFTPWFPAPAATVDPARVLMMGLRSVDGPERRRLADDRFRVADMRAIDEGGIAAPLTGFLDRVEATNGLLHVSLDVDFLDPAIAPAVGTTVPGGATFREAHLIMEMLADRGLVASLDLAELNPYLDHQGRTADLIVDLVASLFGKTVLDRPTRRTA